MLIRAATADDIPAILKIEQQTEVAVHWTEQQYRQAFEKEGTRRVMVVAEDDSRILGFGVVRLVHPGAEIENLIVIPDLRQKGVGTNILNSLIEMARKEGVTELHLEVRESNTAARALYNKIGWRENGRRKRYYQNPEEDAILYYL